jgi:hypothetical protein
VGAPLGVGGTSIGPVTINLYVDDRNLGQKVQTALLDLARRNGGTTGIT